MFVTPEDSSARVGNSVGERPSPSETNARFERDGLVRFDNLFDDETLDALVADRPFAGDRGSELFRFSTQPILASFARRFLGDDARLFNAAICERAAGRRASRRYRNDIDFVDTPDAQLLTCIVALTDSDAETGAVISLPGAHRLGDPALLDDGRSSPELVPARERVEAMRRGTLMVLSPRLPRRFAPNHADAPMLYCGIQFVGGSEPVRLRDDSGLCNATFANAAATVQVVHNGQLVVIR